MVEEKLDLSFLEYRDAVDKAQAAARHWRGFTSRRRSPLTANMRRWAAATSDLPAGRRPKFEELSELANQQARQQEDREKVLAEIFSKPNQDRARQAKMMEKFRKVTKKQLENKKQIVLKQKNHRDDLINQQKNYKYEIPPKDDIFDYVQIFPTKPIVEILREEEIVSVDEIIVRLKNNQEIFQDILDVNFIKFGDEIKARCETVIYLIKLGIDLNDVDTTVKIQDHFDEPEFETKAYDFEITEIKTELKVKEMETEEEIERQMKKEISRKISEEIEKLNEPETSLKTESNINLTEFTNADIFAEMNAWLRIHCKNICREEKEQIENIKQLAPKKLNLVKVPESRRETDNYCDTIKQWKIEENTRKLNECLHKMKEIEKNYIICTWLLHLNFMKNYIRSNVKNIILTPKIDITEHIVLQLELDTFLFEHPNIDRARAESCIDYFMNIWLKANEMFLKPTQEIESCQRLLEEKLRIKTIDLLENCGPQFLELKEIQDLKEQINILLPDKI